METVGLPIRPDWVYEVNVLGQHLVFECADAGRVGFERALRTFSQRLPPARSLAEREWLRERLAAWCSRHAARLHLRYHAETGPTVRCDAPLERAIGAWGVSGQDPRTQFHHWLEVFFDHFDRDHPEPVADRAGRLLLERCAAPPSVRTLARELATSASTLTRAFRGEYGVSIGEFVRQARVRLIVTGLREPQASIKLLAAQAGFASRTSLYAALMHYAGLTPTQVRSLSVAEFDSLLSTLMPVGKTAAPVRGSGSDRCPATGASCCASSRA
jgi:AraC-like DNA-binding protein